MASSAPSISYSNGFTLLRTAPLPPPAVTRIVRGVPSWKFVLVAVDGTQIAELSAAKGKSVTWPLNDAASASFTIDGTHPQAALIEETETDLVVYDKAGVKRFRGRMGNSSDAIGATGHVSSFSAVDYRGFYARRLLRGAAMATFVNWDQGDIAWQLIADSNAQPGNTGFVTRGSYPSTGVTRTLTFTTYAKIADLINSQLANVDNGFDWEIDGDLKFNVFYPERGNVTAMVLDYNEKGGGHVLSAQRTKETSNFARFVAETGADGVPPVEVESSDGGDWEVALGDTTIQDEATLALKADFDLAQAQVLIPGYDFVINNSTGWWSPEALWLGDTAQVVVRSGRVFDIAQERVTQVQIGIGDDGGEVVTLTTGPVFVLFDQILSDAVNRITKLETI
jgi:hypothetical protein